MIIASWREPAGMSMNAYLPIAGQVCILALISPTWKFFELFELSKKRLIFDRICCIIKR